jgi:hypothetical protein
MPNARDPIGLLRLDEVPHDVETRPGVRTLVLVDPRLGKSPEQSVENSRGSTKEGLHEPV